MVQEQAGAPEPTLHRSPSMTGARDRHIRLVADTDRRERQTSTQRRRGKLTAHERLGLLLDPGTFRELGAMRLPRQASAAGSPPREVLATAAGDGVLTGHGTVHGTKVFVFAQDFTVRGGSLGAVHADKIVRLLRMAEAAGCPVVGLYDGGGARIEEGALALDACGALFRQIVRMSGVVPQVSVVLGPCAGAAAYAPALTDAVFMVRDIGMMYLTGPDVVAQVTGERTDGQALGGAGVHGSTSGVASFVHDDERSCLEDVRYLVSLLPVAPGEPPERADPDPTAHEAVDELLRLVPTDPRVPYDMTAVVEAVLDDDTLLPFHEGWGESVLCGLGRVDGHVVGVVANQPLVRAGVLDSAASEKAARFVTWCDAFRIPLVTLVDVPGFMPGTAIERGGIIRHGARLLHAYCAATVPRVQVIVRKAYGGAYIVMDSPATGSDLSYAWPTTEIAVMGPEAAVDIIHRRDLAASPDPAGLRTRLVQDYSEHHLDPYLPARQGLVHEVIDPSATRLRIAEALTLLEAKQTATPVRKQAVAP